jgi:hypothetical protein
VRNESDVWNLVKVLKKSISVKRAFIFAKEESALYYSSRGILSRIIVRLFISFSFSQLLFRKCNFLFFRKINSNRRIMQIFAIYYSFVINRSPPFCVVASSRRSKQVNLSKRRLLFDWQLTVRNLVTLLLRHQKSVPKLSSNNKYAIRQITSLSTYRKSFSGKAK